MAGVRLFSDPDNQLMEEGVPTVSVSGVASRFVSQTDIEAARSRREEQWKAAYARFAANLPITPSLILFRLGQEPPPQPTEDAFDGRSLAEVSLSLPLHAVRDPFHLEIGCEQGKIPGDTHAGLMHTST